jgi:hypothetical protein
LHERINFDTLTAWVGRSAGDTFSKRILGIIDLIMFTFTRGNDFVGRFDVENQVSMDGHLSSQVLKYLEALGYKQSQKEN